MERRWEESEREGVRRLLRESRRDRYAEVPGSDSERHAFRCMVIGWVKAGLGQRHVADAEARARALAALSVLDEAEFGGIQRDASPGRRAAEVES